MDDNHSRINVQEEGIDTGLSEERSTATKQMIKERCYLGICRKEVDPAKAFRGKHGGVYCSKECYILYTED